VNINCFTADVCFEFQIVPTPTAWQNVNPLATPWELWDHSAASMAGERSLC